MALPWKTVLRVWDMFLHDGKKSSSLFHNPSDISLGPKALFRAGLAILLRNKSTCRFRLSIFNIATTATIMLDLLLKCERTSSDLLERLLKAPREITDASRFVEDCLRISLGHKQLEKIREQVKRVHSSLENNSKGSELAAIS